MRRVRVVGIGQRAVGDDGVGLAVLDELRRRAVPDFVELVCVSDAMALVELLDAALDLYLVDAVVAPPAGAVLEVSMDELDGRAAQPASSHGFGVARAVEMARALGTLRSRLFIFGVTIERPDKYGVELSAPVAAAVPIAAERILSRIGACHA